MTIRVRCARCRKVPAEVVDRAWLEEGELAEHYILVNEGTLDRATGAFLCDECYIAVGMPSSPTGWKATPANLRALGLAS